MCYAVQISNICIVLNEKQNFFRAASVSYKRGYYFKTQGPVFLKFVFLICLTLLYSEKES